MNDLADIGGAMLAMGWAWIAPPEAPIAQVSAKKGDGFAGPGDGLEIEWDISGNPDPPPVFNID